MNKQPPATSLNLAVPDKNEGQGFPCPSISYGMMATALASLPGNTCAHWDDGQNRRGFLQLDGPWCVMMSR
jgi:hypothetical protein